VSALRTYPRVVMFRNDPPASVGTPSPLGAATLRLIEGGATPTGLVERFATAGAVIDEGHATRLLAELSRLGIVRVARQNGDGRVHVLTSLGSQIRDSGFGDGSGIAAQLAELERLRTDLLSTIAHELRTPLTAVRTCVGVLRDPETSPTATEQEMLLATIERNADRMQRVVGDILEIARFRTGEVVLQLRRFDAIELARGAVASVAPLAAQRHQEIVLRAPGTSISVFGDHRRLDQALVNLLSNAVKYGPAGGRIEVRVAARRDLVTWSVRDDGPGISPGDQAHLFERFFVGPNGREGGPGGVGLGLPTALAIAQAHGGHIDVDSAPGKGSLFGLVVPRDGPSDAE
jgi:two-component system, OmpR family, phosphate regulon sensor histidine kinase PhoR